MANYLNLNLRANHAAENEQCVGGLVADGMIGRTLDIVNIGVSPARVALDGILAHFVRVVLTSEEQNLWPIIFAGLAALLVWLGALRAILQAQPDRVSQCHDPIPRWRDLFDCGSDTLR